MLKYLGRPKYLLSLDYDMPACINCGSTLSSWIDACPNCQTSLSSAFDNILLNGNIKALNCSNCKQKCSKKVKDACCEKYKRKNKHCSNCPICITNIGIIGSDNFV